MDFMQNVAKANILLANVAQATLFATRFAKILETLAAKPDKTPWVIFLEGELGAGKTTFVRACLQTLGEKGKIKSPTYTILESYDINKWHIYHLDLYRLVDPEELYFLGLEDHLTPESIFFVEWPRKGREFLPEPDVLLNYQFLAQGRALEFSVLNKRAEPLLEAIHEICV